MLPLPPHFSLCSIMMWCVYVPSKQESAAVKAFSTSPSEPPKGNKRKKLRSRCVFPHPHANGPRLLPWYMEGWVSAKEKGATLSPTALQTGPTAVGQREHVALSFTHSFGDQLWSNDAAAINMRQRVWVSDSCTVDQGHPVLALWGRATPKKANPLWEH